MPCTKIGAFKSSYKRISCGDPQGSVISPLLFLIYITDITKASFIHTTLFADDINLYTSNSSFNVLQTTVNLELCKIDHWLRANKFFLNYNKTNFMLLTSRKHNPASCCPLTTARANRLTRRFLVITRHLLQLERCSNPLRIQQV